jgi:murein DD-endopeptidase MepM/ murein hydrolase activator NlpD
VRARVFSRAAPIIAAYLIGVLRASAQQEFALARPINCEFGKTCFVQNYVDHDPSANALDFQCGHRTYDGHDGTDIRLPDLEIHKRGIEVLAAVVGRVARVGDGMDDVSVGVGGRNSVAGSECGNGVVIEHEAVST